MKLEVSVAEVIEVFKEIQEKRAAGEDFGDG